MYSWPWQVSILAVLLAAVSVSRVNLRVCLVLALHHVCSRHASMLITNNEVLTLWMCVDQDTGVQVWQVHVSAAVQLRWHRRLSHGVRPQLLAGVVWYAYVHTHIYIPTCLLCTCMSLPPSLPPSPSVPPCIHPSLPSSLPLSLPSCLPASAPPSLPPSLLPSLSLSPPPSLLPSHPPSLSPSLNYSPELCGMYMYTLTYVYLHVCCVLHIPPSLPPFPSVRPSLPPPLQTTCCDMRMM